MDFDLDNSGSNGSVFSRSTGLAMGIDVQLNAALGGYQSCSVTTSGF